METLVVGDLNLDFLRWINPENNHRDMIENTKDKVESKGYAQMVSGATRFWPGTVPSLMDQSWSNRQENIIHCKNIHRPVADHNAVETIIRMKGNIRTKGEQLKRKWKYFDPVSFQKRVEGMNWNEIYTIKDVNLAYSFLEEKLQTALNEAAPIVKIQPSRRKKSWIQQDTLEMIEVRDRMKIKANETDETEDWNDYRRARNDITAKIKKDKKDYFTKMYNRANSESNSKNLFRITKEQLGWNSEGQPSALTVGGKYVTKPMELAEHLSKFFDEKIENLKRNIPVTNLDPVYELRKAMENWPGAANRPELELRNVTLLEVLNIIRELGNSTTMGHDLLDPLTLKLVVGTVSKPIQHILNLSINSQTYCNKWKLGKLLPLFKGEGCQKLSIKSYRPISILPTISKIMEKAVQNQVLKFLEDTNQLNKNLHGYRELHSTTTMLLQLTDFISDSADDGMIANAMFVDQSAVFDCVNAGILDEKLKIYNFSENTRKWFRCYMSYRSQYVNIGGANSSIRSVKSGVPQGSVLGPMLFTLYTNELPEITKADDCDDASHNMNEKLFGENCMICGIIPCYADDCTIVVAHKRQTENKTDLNKKLNKITEFLQSNQLSINQSKTKTQNYMVRQKRARVDNDPVMMTVETEEGTKDIKNEIHAKILGINLQEDLGWRSQLESGTKPLLPNLRRRVGALRHIRNQIPRKGRLILANGLVLSKMLYMIQVWGGVQKTHMTKLQKIMNSAARFVINGGKKWRSRKLMTECGWLMASELEEFHTLVLLWKIMNFKKPQVLAEKFSWCENGSISSRSGRLMITSGYFKTRSVQHWNNMSEELKFIKKDFNI